MKPKLKPILAKLILAIVFIITTNTLNSQITYPSLESLQAQPTESESSYRHDTYYDNAGRIVGTYESLYIPPVVKYADGAYITLSPASFEERFTKMDYNSFGPKLQNVVTGSVPRTGKPKINELQQRLNAVHSTMANTMDGLNNFMGMAQDSSSIRTRQCSDILGFVNKKLYEAKNVELDLAEAINKLNLADESGNFLDQLRQRQIVVEKSINTAAFLDGIVNMGNEWNSGRCVAMGTFQKMQGPFAPDVYKAKAEKIRESLKGYEDSLADFTAQLIEKISDYNIAFSEFEGNRTKLNSLLKTMHQKSQSQESLRDDFNKACDQIKTLQAMLEKLSKQASELDFQDEKIIFDATGKSLADTQSTLDELEKAEATTDTQSRRSQTNDAWTNAEKLFEQRTEELASELEADQLRKDAEKARQAEDKLSPKEKQKRDKENAASKKSQEQAAQMREERKNDEQFEFDVNPLQISRELDNFDAMFSAGTQPEIAVFDNVVKSFLGENIGKNIPATTPFDSNRQGDYMIGSYQYRDDKFGINMEVGSITKMDDSSASSDWNECSWNNMEGSEKRMTVHSINYVPNGEQITIALSSDGEKVLIKTDRRSIENYLAKKAVERDLLINPKAGGYHSGEKIDPASLPITNAGKPHSKLRNAASVVADFLPYVGTGKAISELIFGHDYISGQDASRVVAIFAVAGSLVPVPGAAKAGKFVGKVVVKVAGEAPAAIKKVQAKYSQAGLAAAKKLKTELSGEKMSKLLQKYADTKEAINTLSDGVRNILRMGKLPVGYVLHHKIPLFRKGTNKVENLTVKKEATYAKYEKFLKNKIPGLTEAPKAFTEAGYKGASRYYTLVDDQMVHAHDLIKQMKPRVQEQLKHMHIPEKPLVPGGGLLKHEANGGHVIEKHVGKSDDHIHARRAAGREGPISTFKNLEEAEYFVAETINKNKDEIAEWLKNSIEPKKLELAFKNAVGKLLEEGETVLQEVFVSRVILKLDAASELGYRIVTAYPAK